MSGPGLFEFTFEDGDVDDVLAGRRAEPAETVEASDELTGLSRRIAGQYAEVVAAFASHAFAGRSGEAALQQVRMAVNALRRLSQATHDDDVLLALDRLDGVLEHHSARGGRARQRFLKDLRDALLALADHLEPADADRLRNLVVFDRRALPLLDELANLPGIGPRRLERLYCAGLFTVEAVGAANPEEIAQVTGLPRPLAERVVEATRQFAGEQRRRVLTELQERATQLNAALTGIPLDPTTDHDLADMARSALVELQAALERLDKHNGRPA
jgi:predicted flap endonuclease-1-like 5' DNA nuclease